MKKLILLILLLSNLAIAEDRKTDPLIVELFSVLKMETLLTNKAYSYKKQFGYIYNENNLSAEQLALARKHFDEVIDQVIGFYKSEKVLKAFGEAYRETFNDEELNEIIAFYSSRTGQKMLETSPELNAIFMKKIAPDVQNIIQELTLSPQ